MKIQFVFGNVGIDRWIEERVYKDLDTYIRKTNDGWFYNLLKTVESENHEKFKSILSMGLNSKDFKDISTCYIRNKFFMLYNNSLLRKLREKFSNVVFILSEFCHINYQASNLPPEVTQRGVIIESLNGKVEIEKNISVLDCENYFVQRSQKSPDIQDGHVSNKYFITASCLRDPGVYIHNTINDEKKFIDSEVNTSSLDKYFGCAQVSYLIVKDKPRVCIINFRNRIYYISELIQVMQRLMNQYKDESNIVFVGDINCGIKTVKSRKGKDPYYDKYTTNEFCQDFCNRFYGIKVHSRSDISKDTNKLISSNQRFTDETPMIENLYMQKTGCKTGAKSTHLRLFHYLNDYTLRIDTNKRCDISFKTSAHEFILFELSPKS